jgi:hypothetical protein
MAMHENMQEKFRHLNEKGQRIQHQTEVIARNLAIASATLEMLTEGHYSPEVKKIAGDLLDKLKVDSVSPLFSIAGPTQPVTVADLKGYRGLLDSLATELDASVDDAQTNGSIAMLGLQKVVVQASANVNVQALWLRNGILEMFLREGYLSPLQSYTELDERVLEVAATIPFGGHDLNPNVFVQSVRAKGVNISEGTGDRLRPLEDEATRRLRLQRHCRLMNVDTQQLQFENQIAGRSMSIAHTALENLAKEENGPEVVKLARGALRAFDASSEPGAFQDLAAGAPIPPVDPDDLRRIHAAYTEESKPHTQANVAIGTAQLASLCGRGASVAATSLRSALLRILVGRGLLAQWQHGTELHEAVYKVAATISLDGPQLDPDDFIQRLKKLS